ncbi:sirohydrochlorin chelatase [Arsenicicoccus sp. oral taxon 190]|uniref:sirohydrochlorin chelatase n=1 Tax=Arsenicicoccus sp. oral taxon 190 TaxID=1658671 RepID=UPI00067A0179|nr:CbiX/SirB N-terminal domain-containing protein [Arsenicicoccus sp. oral taxon 190]AKT52587.1 hypothetical protein ADJ73_04370 [Arsenicicoccus sp. oral taxon 190]
MTSTPVLLLVAHGTRSAKGQRTVTGIAERLRERRPELQVELAYVDVQEPHVGDRVAALTAAGLPVVVVPLLLSLGYHVEVDIARAVAGRESVCATWALGPDPILAEILVDRAREAGAEPGDALVVAAAGSSRERAQADVDALVAEVARRWAGPVSVGYGSAAAPTIAEAVTAARAAGSRGVVVAAYLIGPGHFADVVTRAGADRTTEPLGTHPRLLTLVEQRYAEGLERLAPTTTVR